MIKESKNFKVRLLNQQHKGNYIKKKLTGLEVLMKTKTKILRLRFLSVLLRDSNQEWSKGQQQRANECCHR